MPQKALRKYGVQTTLNFTLYETDGINFKLDAVHASGDTKIMKNEGAEANTDNGFTDEGQGYSIVITATEMEAARLVIYIVDQSTKVWLDDYIVVETYGHASAMHAFDLDTALAWEVTKVANMRSLKNKNSRLDSLIMVVAMHGNKYPKLFELLKTIDDTVVVDDEGGPS